MRAALGQPLCDVSSTVLNKMVNKDVASSPRKFKNGGARTPDKRRSKSRGGMEDGDDASVRFQDSSAAGPNSKRGRGKSIETVNNKEFVPSMNNTIKGYLRDLDNGIGDKISLLKMLVIKSDEAD